jgi:hypothetical protein
MLQGCSEATLRDALLLQRKSSSDSMNHGGQHASKGMSGSGRSKGRSRVRRMHAIRMLGVSRW